MKELIINIPEDAIEFVEEFVERIIKKYHLHHSSSIADSLIAATANRK